MLPRRDPDRHDRAIGSLTICDALRELARLGNIGESTGGSDLKCFLPLEGDGSTAITFVAPAWIAPCTALIPTPPIP
jgi:hypothetical protein